MLRVGTKSLIALVVVFALCTCIDPYTPQLEGYESLLVVDGLITDENSSYTIKLSRTIQEQNAIPVMVSGATVYITDELGNITFLSSVEDGVYKTDSTEFKGAIGKTYILHVMTPDGNEYESEQCPMQSVPDIDTIYFARDQELINNGTEIQVGLMIFLDSKEGDSNKYYRWDFVETWKFKVPNPKKFNYINENTIVPVAEVKEYCWREKKSDEVIIHSVYSGEDERIVNEPIFFIATEKSERLMMQYSILIKQYSLSKKEYDFWDNLKSINESGGDIFATQPFPVISNIRNINNPQEQVLGYFQVSAVKQKRKNIFLTDIIELDLPFYHYPCERLELAREDVPWPKFAPPLTWDGLHEIYCINSDYYFVEPRYKQGTIELDKLVFTRPECADCEVTGTMIKPDFWIDID